MANINVNEIGYNEVLSAGTANALMVQYKRANAAPMDITEVHTTKQSAENYARNGSTSYAGQVISEAGENIKTRVYKITSGGTLLELIDEETLTEEIANIISGGELNLKDYAKTEYVDERDNEILQAAKDYADGITPEIDFSPYYTKEETDNTFQVKGNYTTIECVENKLETLKSVYAPKAEFEEVQKKINDITSTGGEPNVQSDWNTIDTESDSYIKNKPDLTVYATKEQLESEINGVVSNVTTLSGVVGTFSADVKTTLADYITTDALETYKGEVSSNIETAKNEAIVAASAYTDGQIETVRIDLDSEIEGVEAVVEALSGVVESFSADVKTTLNGYITTGALNEYKDVVTGDIATAKSEAIIASSAYTDSQIGAIKTYLDSEINTVSGNIETTIINLSTVYAPKAEFEAVQKKINDITSTGGEPNVQSDWNITDNTSDAFIKNKPDLKYYATTTSLDELDSEVAILSGVVESFSADVKTTLTDYITTGALNTYKNEVTGDIATAKSEAIIAASAYTVDQIEGIKTYLDSEIEGVETGVETLSGIVETFSANVETTLTGYVTTGALNEYKDVVTGDIATAKSEAIIAASAYTDIQISDVKTKLENQINTVSGNIGTTIVNLNTVYAPKAEFEEVRSKVEGIISVGGGEPNVQSDWNTTDINSDSYIKNKPNLDIYATKEQIESIDANIVKIGSDIIILSGVVNTIDTIIEESLNDYVTIDELNVYSANIKSEVINSVSSYTDSRISDIQTDWEAQIDTLSNNIEAIIKTLSGEVSEVKEEYVTNIIYTAYTAATESAYKNAANDAKNDAIAAASAYTDGQIVTTKTSLEGQIGVLDTKVANLSGVVESFSANVKTTLTGYVATSALNTYKNEVSGDIATAKSEAISSAKTYVDAKVSGVQGNLDKTDAALVALSGNVVTIIDNDNGKTIRIIAAEEVAKVVAGADKKFDTLKEIADYIANDITSAATLANDITELKSSATSVNTRLSTIEEDLDKVEGDITTLSGAVESKYATSADTVSAIAIVNNRFSGYATSASTVAAIKVVNDKFSNYATSAATVTAINNVDVKFKDYATSADTVSAIKVVNDKFGSYATSANTVAAIKVVNDKFSNYATSAATVTAINTVNDNFKDYATSAATHKAIANHISTTNSQINTLEDYVIASANTLSGNIETTINTLSGNLATSISKKAIITTTPTSNKLILLGLQLKNNTEFVGGTLLQSSTTPIYMQDGELYSQSDERLKDFADDIIIDFDKLSNIPKRYFKYKNSEEWHIGTSAQAIREVYPEIVNKCDDGNLSVAYDKLSIIALAAIDKLYNENIELKKRLKLIEEKLGI